MAMTPEQKKKMLAGFHNDVKQTEQEEYVDPWTDEDLIRISEKIMERLEKNDRNRTENKNG